MSWLHKFTTLFAKLDLFWIYECIMTKSTTVSISIAEKLRTYLFWVIYYISLITTTVRQSKCTKCSVKNTNPSWNMGFHVIVKSVLICHLITGCINYYNHQLILLFLSNVSTVFDERTIGNKKNVIWYFRSIRLKKNR